MKSKFVWIGIVIGGTTTALYMAREKIAAFAVKMASNAAVKATVSKAKDTSMDVSRKVSGVRNKQPGKLKVG